jgi:hypothetical protein
MRKTERDNMLLFSKERAPGSYRYRLYFTPVSSLSEETPRVFRLLVRTPFSFNRFEIGRIYSLVYYNVNILAYKPGDEFNLAEEHYIKLLQTRDLKFMDKKTSAALRSMEKPSFSKDRYYTFRETKGIVNFRPDPLTNIAVSTVSFVMSGLSFLIPFCAYAMVIYLMIKGQLSYTGFSPSALSLPVIGIGALPITMFLMLVLFSLSEFALLRIDFTRWSVLKKYTLDWGGIRKSFFFELSDIRYLSRFGLISAIVLGVSIIIAIIL